MLRCYLPLLTVALIARAFCPGIITATEPVRGAKQAVNEALFQETLGDNRARAKLLSQAEQANVENAAIHWAQGKILLHDRWLTPEEIATAARNDEVAAEYVWQRASAGEDDVEAQWKLALWCKKRDLPLQCNVHLARVLTLAPDHLLARREAGYTRTNGRWTHPRETAAARKAADEQAAVLKKWQPILERLVRQVLLGSEVDREAAEQQIASLSQPDAVAVFEQSYSALDPRLTVLAIKKLAAIDDPAVSLALARQAVFSPWQETRDLAAEQLRQRPVEEYAPIMLATLRTPVEAHVYKEADAAGRVVVQQKAYVETQHAHQVFVSEASYLKPYSREFFTRSPKRRLMEGRTVTAPRPTIFTDAAYNNIAQIERNDRIIRAMVTATGESLGDEPQAWWKWWNETNELYTPEKPILYEYYYSTYCIPYVAHTKSCFLQGTPVWTVTGMQPIEEIKPGDLVLAKDVETGELAYKPVLQTTVRPPAAIVRIEAGENLKIDATGGHRFWVSGEGWVKARELKSGSPLHTASGVVLVSDVQEQPKAPAYNLVVADYHNYFVTDAKVLCQDNLMPQPTAVKVPGLRVD